MSLRAGERRGRRFLAIGLALLISALPHASAGSGMAWSGAVESVDGRGLGHSVDASNGDWVVSAHDSHIHVFDADSTETIHSWNLADTVKSARLSSDSSHLVLGLDSDLPSTPSMMVYDTSNWERIQVFEDGQSVDRISITPQGERVASQNENGGVTIWEVASGEVVQVLDGVHTSEIRCVALHPSGNQILTGGFEGDVTLWNVENATILDQWSAGSGLSECAFHPQGNLMAWAAQENLFVRNFDSDYSYRLTKSSSSHIQRLRFSQDGGSLHLLLSSRIIDELKIDSGEDWQRSNRYDIGHLASDFSLDSTNSRLFVATGGNLVSLFRTTPAGGSVQPGLDFDQDGIPDAVDEDDDGDGILDDVDNLCDAGSNCHLSPDPDLLRTIRMSANGRDFTITETVQFTPEQSLQLRVLGAKILTGDHMVDVTEARELSDMLCSAHDDADIIGRWNSALTVEGQSIETATVACTAMPGLKSTTNTDRSSRVSLTWTIEARLLIPLEAPFNLSLVAGLPTPANSPAEIAPQFPVRVVIDDISGGQYDLSVWHQNANDLIIIIQPPPEPAPSALELALISAGTYWYVLVMCAAALLGLGLLLMRRHNEIDFEMEDEDEDEANHEDAFLSDVDELYNEALEEDVWVEESPRAKPRPPAAVQQDLDSRKPKRGAPRPPPDAREEAPKRKAARRKKATSEGVSEMASTDSASKRRAAKRKKKATKVDLQSLVDEQDSQESTSEESAASNDESAMEDALKKMLG